MDEHRLRCFVTVVETGNLSKAAIKLHMTQPPLSILIRKLEDELEATLFERINNRLILSDTGQIFYRRAKELLASMQALAQEVAESSKGLRGTVTVGCSTAASLFIIPKVMEELRARQLDISVQVHEGETAHMLERLRNRQIDIGIFRTSYKTEDLQTMTLYSEPLLLALPKSHRLLKNHRVSLTDLKNERFLMHSPTQGQGISNLLIESCQLCGFSPNVVYWGTETLPMLLMVEKGLGIAFAPKSFGGLKLPGLPKLVEIKQPLLETKLSLVTQKNRILSAVTQRFLEITAEVIKGLQSA
ncbi:LysR family transcriptional regulator [Paralcaligenes sp. KSB-10]|uniref:LysR family transcriptional regulator n=1 Tax=Paralcaligenes sp. KSB-10 TaxID=2901142 RepID=UPI001E307A6C|nr:LysR family transcriptional regulator [Paralcaligenes sp. KSB-10]UHL65591.1 LysR family transcriptional regulator [Paralcaligenes sp. KSB-10]